MYRLSNSLFSYSCIFFHAAIKSSNTSYDKKYMYTQRESKINGNLIFLLKYNLVH